MSASPGAQAVARRDRPGGDRVGEPPPEPLRRASAAVDAQRRRRQPARAQVRARRAQLSLQALLRPAPRRDEQGAATPARRRPRRLPDGQQRLQRW